MTATGVVAVDVAGAVLEDPPPPPQPANSESDKAQGSAYSALEDVEFFCIGSPNCVGPGVCGSPVKRV